MKFIGKYIEESDAPFSNLCQKQLEGILKTMSLNEEFDNNLGVKNIKIHENGVIINFILEPASALDPYTANIPCTIFIFDQDKQAIVIENEEKEKCKEYERKMGTEIKKTKQTRILHRQIENAEYWKKYKEIISFLGEILQELQKDKGTNPRKH